MENLENGQFLAVTFSCGFTTPLGWAHPLVSLQLVELSKAQDVEAGDGTTTVVVLAGSLLTASQQLLSKGIHPTTISESFQIAADKAVQVLEGMSTKVALSDHESLLKSATTSLCSKVTAIPCYCLLLD